MITYEQLKKEILKELKIDHLPENDQKKIVEKLGEVILQRLSLELLKSLPEDKKEEFKKLSDTGDLPVLYDLVRAELPNSDEIIANAIKDVVDLIK